MVSQLVDTLSGNLLMVQACVWLPVKFMATLAVAVCAESGDCGEEK